MQVAIPKSGNNHIQLQTISLIQARWVEQVKGAYLQEPQLQELINNHHKGLLDSSQYQVRNGLLFYKGRHLGGLLPLQREVLHQFHSSPLGAHTGVHKIYAIIKKEFFWHGLKSDVQTFGNATRVNGSTQQSGKHSSSWFTVAPPYSYKKLGRNQHGLYRGTATVRRANHDHVCSR